MNRQELEGKWTQVKGRAKEQWGKLTDDDLDQIEGKQQVLVGKIQERYGKEREDASREVDSWMNTIDGQSTSSTPGDSPTSRR